MATTIQEKTPEVLGSPQDGISIVRSPDSLDWKDGERIEDSVFVESGYAKPGETAQAYAPYLANSEFVVVKRAGQAIASTRLTHYGPEGFKTLDDIKNGKLEVDEAGQQMLDQLDLNHTFEVGTLAAIPEVRAKPEDDGRAAVDLYSAIYGESTKRDCPSILASFDADYFNRFAGIFGPSAHALGPARELMGSPTVPVLIEVPALMEHLKTNIPQLHDAIVNTAATITYV